MYDYWKLRIRDRKQIQKILNNPLFEFKLTVNRSTGELHEFPQIAKWNVWEIKAFSNNLLEIRGSIHKYWNKGTNETDFSHSEAKKAIKAFCQVFQLNPSLAYITNLEFGVNVHSDYAASDLIMQVLCLKNKLPSHPYCNNDRSYFIEIKNGEYYVKLYDKGKQLNTTNILRYEVKGMKERYFAFTGIQTLKDLSKKNSIPGIRQKVN